MIEATHLVSIDTDIDNVWDYVQDISRWAELFPGCRDCQIIDDNHSKWTIKVGAGGMIKTVNVLVNVTHWGAPEQVDFTFELESEPVVGSGTYRATRKSDRATDINLQLQVEGSGQMAPMWEAMSKPLLPQMAKTFSDRLKAEIEARAPEVPAPTPRRPLLAGIGRWLQNIWWAILGSPTEKRSLADGEKAREQANRAVVLQFIEAMSTSNAALAEPCLAPGAFTIAKGYGKFAGKRPREVMVGTIDAFNQLLPTGLNVSIKSVTPSGNTVAVEFEGDGTTSAGTPYHNQYCMVFMLAQGKIEQVNEYFCNVHADEVLWPLVAPQADLQAEQSS